MLALFGAYEMSTFLAFAAVGKLKISYLKFGPTEFRLALVIINALLIRYGTRHMIGGLKYVNAGAAVGLGAMIYTNHRKIWQIDMAQKDGDAQSAQSHDSIKDITIHPRQTMYELGSR